MSVTIARRARLDPEQHVVANGVGDDARRLRVCLLVEIRRTLYVQTRCSEIDPQDTLESKQATGAPSLALVRHLMSQRC